MSDYKRLTEKDWHKEKFYPKAENERVIRKRLWDLENKSEQGTLIELPKMPFKIGGTAYWLNGLPNCIQEYKVRGYSVGRLGLRIDLGDLEPLLYEVFGKRLFCSREEAEKRLLEL